MIIIGFLGFYITSLNLNNIEIVLSFIFIFLFNFTNLFIFSSELDHLLFYSPVFSQGKNRNGERSNIKTIRFDKKKWKDHLVLHYLISKWIFFLITFRRHQDLQILISPKSLILQTKKFLQNDARIQKRLKRLGFCRKV